MKTKHQKDDLAQDKPVHKKSSSRPSGILHTIAISALFLMIICFAATFLILTCTEDKEPSAVRVIESASEFIEASVGGIIETKSGIMLTVPPLALPSDETVKIKNISVKEMADKWIVLVGFSPEGIELLKEATLRIPVPDENAADEDELEIIEFAGDDAEYALPTDVYASISGYSGNYYVTLPVDHFSGKGLKNNCHSGTFSRIIESFTERGCDQDTIFKEINTRFVAANVSEACFNFTNRLQIRGLLSTFFNTSENWGPQQDVPKEALEIIKEYVRDGGKVVLAFGAKSGNEFKHTVVLETDPDGTVQMVNTCEVPSAIRTVIGQNEVMVKCPLDSVNWFRKLKSGVAMEMAICGSPGCLNDPKKNNFKKELLQQPLEKRTAGAWGSVSIFIEKADQDMNPCEYLKKSKLYCVWYAENISLQPVMVGTMEEFNTEELCKYYPGGGNDPNLIMEKVLMVEGYGSKEEAIAAACLLFDDVYRLPGSSTFVWTTWLGWIGETRHDVDELEGCPYGYGDKQ